MLAPREKNLAQRATTGTIDLSDEGLARLELAQDLLYYRLDPEQQTFYIARALAIGAETAIRFRPREAERIIHVAERSGCRVHFVNDQNKISGLHVRTEYRPSQSEIVVYRRSVDQMLTVLNELISGVEAWTSEQVEDIHVAHELFHHVEATETGLVNLKLPKVVTFRWGPLVRKMSVRRAREIAAHKFTKDIMGLPYLSNFIDYAASKEHDLM